MYVVYGLEDPTTIEIFYVGMATDVYQRFIQHLKCGDDNVEKNMRIDGLRAKGIVPTLITLEVLHAERLGRQRETYWIEHYAYLGAPLTNISQLKKVRKHLKQAAYAPAKVTITKQTSKAPIENERIVRDTIAHYPQAGPREISRRANIPVCTAQRWLKRIRESQQSA